MSHFPTYAYVVLKYKPTSTALSLPFSQAAVIRYQAEHQEEQGHEMRTPNGLFGEPLKK